MSDTIRTERRGETMRKSIYHVQCLAGHVFKVPHGSDLEKRAINRAKHGYLDALCVSWRECPICGEDELEGSYDHRADEQYMQRCIEKDLFSDHLERISQDAIFYTSRYDLAQE